MSWTKVVLSLKMYMCPPLGSETMDTPVQQKGKSPESKERGYF